MLTWWAGAECYFTSLRDTCRTDLRIAHLTQTHQAVANGLTAPRHVHRPLALAIAKVLSSEVRLGFPGNL
jgi:hypothetical protein